MTSFHWRLTSWLGMYSTKNIFPTDFSSLIWHLTDISSFLAFCTFAGIPLFLTEVSSSSCPRTVRPFDCSSCDRNLWLRRNTLQQSLMWQIDWSKIALQRIFSLSFQPPKYNHPKVNWVVYFHLYFSSRNQGTLPSFQHGSTFDPIAIRHASNMTLRYCSFDLGRWQVLLISTETVHHQFLEGHVGVSKIGVLPNHEF